MIQNGLDDMRFQEFKIEPEKDYIKSRKTLFVNAAIHIDLAEPKKSTPCFYKNWGADEIIFLHDGRGISDLFLFFHGDKKGDSVEPPSKIN